MVVIEDVDEEEAVKAAVKSSMQQRQSPAGPKKDPAAAANAKPSRAFGMSDPCPDLEIECSAKGAQEAKEKGNRLYSEGKVAECERWFTKAVWLYETGKVRDFPGDLQTALHGNRALARIKLQRFADAESDCSVVLEDNPQNPKARYRRATARFELGKLVPALQDVEKALGQLPEDSRAEAQDLKARILSHLGPVQGTAGKPGEGWQRMEQIEVKDGEKESGYTRIPITEVDVEEPPPKSAAPTVSAKAAPAPGFRRMEIVEASDDEDDEPAPVSNGIDEPQQASAPPEPFADIHVEFSVQGLEKAKEKANVLFAEGKTTDSERWFSKAIWVAEESGKVKEAPKVLQSVLHSNRAYARLKLKKWSEAEEDCTKAMSLNSNNAKALYRRAQARLELKQRAGALEDVEKLLPLLAAPTDKEARELREKILALPGGEAPKKADAPKPASPKAEAPKPASPKAPKAAPSQPVPKAAPQASEPPPGFKRMEIVEASDSEEEEPAKMSNGHGGDQKPTSPAKPASKSPAAADPPAGFRRLEIQEASDDEDDAPAPKAPPVKAPPPKAPSPKASGPPEPFPDIQVEASAEGLEKAKQQANRLFADGKTEDSERWFSKAIWVSEESGKLKDGPKELRSILHSNRAYTRLRLKKWSQVEEDCGKAIALNPSNAKAYFRRAQARVELKNRTGGLEDVDKLLPLLAHPGDKEALDLKKRLQALPETKPAAAPAAPAEAQAAPKPPSPAAQAAPKPPSPAAAQPPPGFKRLEIVEASDDEDEDEPPKMGNGVSTPNGSGPTSPVKAEAKAAATKPPSPKGEKAEPFPELKFERTRQGVETAKAAGSRVFGEGDFSSASKHFSKGLWLLDEVPDAKTDPSWAKATRQALHSNRALAEMKLEHWQATEDDCSAALQLSPEAVKPLYRRAMAREKLGKKAEALKDAEAALKGQPDSQELRVLRDRLAQKEVEVVTPPGFKRMQIVEASDSEDEAPAQAKPAEPKKAPAAAKAPETPQAPAAAKTPETPQAPPEPFADIKLEYTVEGAEKAKQEGNRLFAEGKVEESVRWFSKAIWLVEESGKVTGVTATLRGILHSNRAFARLKLQKWAEAEVDCSEALALNASNAKALYRRAMARKELRKWREALDDVEKLLPMLEQPHNKDALALKEELVRLLAPPVKEVQQAATPAPAEPVQKPPSPAGTRSAVTAPATAAALPASSPKNSMEMLRQFKSLKRHPAVLTQYVVERVPPPLLYSLFSKSPIEADDLAMVLQSLRTASAADAPMPATTVGEYLQQLLRTHAAETQFSMLSTSEKQLVRELVALVPQPLQGDLEKRFRSVLS